MTPRRLIGILLAIAVGFVALFSMVRYTQPDETGLRTAPGAESARS